MVNAPSFTSSSLLPLYPTLFHSTHPILKRSNSAEQRNHTVISVNGSSSTPNKNFMEETSKENRVVGTGKSLESGANYKASEKTQAQKLIDQLHFCAASESLTEARAIHGYILKSNFDDESLLVLLNHVMHVYLKCSDFKTSKTVFNSLPNKNVFSWSAMIVGSNEHGFFSDGLNYFSEMMDHGIFPDTFAYGAILQTCIGLDYIDLGKIIHSQIIIRGFGYHIIVSTALLNMYSKLGEIEEAYKVFNSMHEHNEVSWNAMISGFTANGRFLEAFNYFLTMKENGFSPNIFTLLSVSKAVGMLGDVDKANLVSKYALGLGIQSNIRVGTSLIDMYSKCGDLLQAKNIFDTHFANGGVNAPWNAMISGYSLSKCSQEALKLFVQMCENNIKADVYTYCSVFDAIADLKCSWFVREVHGMVLKSGYDLIDRSIENAIADAYSKCGFLEDVEKIFNRMRIKDLVSWTTLLTAYSQSSNWEEAITKFSQMREEGFFPNNFTLASVLTACSNLCYLEYGRQIHGLLYKLGFDTDRCVESALIDVYAKGGSINEAEIVYKHIPYPDVVSYTAIISGYANHGLFVNALQEFQEMEKTGVNPNAVTLLCILFACSHVGLVDKGLDYFYSMEKNYGLVPKMEHYACVVDILGRVGKIDEAFDFINEMPIRPNQMVWQSLLAACKIHGNVNLGEIAAKKILSFLPENSSTYVLLSNTYMEYGSFDDGVRLREVMKEKGVRKEPGFSWINVKGKVHRFYAGDKEHLEKDGIFCTLLELTKMMKDLGYKPDLRCVLQGGD